MKQLKLLAICALITSLLLISSCGDDDGGPGAVTLVSLTVAGTDLSTGNATEIDLNGASSAEDVPLDAVITAVFSKALDAATVTNTNITLNNGTSDITITVAVNAETVTVTPASDLERGVEYTLTVSSNVAASDGGAFADASRTFSTAGRADITPPQADAMEAYFKLNGDGDDAAGNFLADAEIDIEYVADRFGNIESAALFNGNTSLIEIPNGDDLFVQESVTISFWMSIDTTDHINTAGNGNAGHFILGVGNFHGFQFECNGSANTMKMATTYANPANTETGIGGGDVFFNGDGMTGDNGGFIAVEFEQDLTGSGEVKGLLAQKWAHVVWVYDGAENKTHLYINGALMETDNHNLVEARADYNGLVLRPNDTNTIGTKLALGFSNDRETDNWAGTGFGDYTITTSNHYKGALDDIRFFNAPLSAAEVAELHEAEQ